MSKQDITMAFLADQTSQVVFDAINNVPAWWSGEVKGETGRLGGEFTYRVEGAHYTKQKITEFVSAKKVVWHVTESEISYVQDKGEWQGTDIVFEITRKGAKTEVRFTHAGLPSGCECYKEISNAWGMLVNGNLRQLIATGKPQPSPW
jgi:hypothetical protein